MGIAIFMEFDACSPVADRGVTPHGLNGESQKARPLPPTERHAAAPDTLSYPKFKPENRFLLISQSDNDKTRSSILMRDYNHIPNDHAFFIDTPYKHPLNKNAKPVPKWHQKPANLTDKKNPLPLAAVRIQDRLDIHGHGNEYGYEHLEPEELAEKLHSSGLKNVGVIKFDSCLIGASDYLEKFGKALHEKNIKFGYIAGSTKVRRRNRVPINIFGKTMLWGPIPLGPKRESVLNDKPFGTSWKDYMRIVPGNQNIVFRGTRYNTNV